MRETKRYSKIDSGTRIRAVLAVVLVLAAGPLGAQGSSEDLETRENRGSMEGLETAVFAGGCFWGVEAVFEHLHGVVDVVSGYSGGNARDAEYAVVSSGRTGHAEAVRVVFDPELIGYEELLSVFFLTAHDPTQLDYQGPDIGPQYRSEIFFLDARQRDAAQRAIDELDGRGTFTDPIVTRVSQLDEFYPAEDYHQDFVRKYPTHPYVAYWDLPKLEHLREAFPELYRGPDREDEQAAR